MIFSYSYKDKDIGYEPSTDRLLEEVVNIIYCDYFYDKEMKQFESKVKENIREFIVCFGLLYDLVKEYKKDLKDIFKQEAIENCG